MHVDDCPIAATAIMLINHFKKEIAKHVEITDLGELHWLLGIKIRCDWEKHTILLSQHLYIDSILCHYNLQDLKPVSIPRETFIHLSTSQSPATTAKFAQMCDVLYHEAVGSLMYASLRMHPDISFTVQTVSCFSTKSWTYSFGCCQADFSLLEGYKGSLVVIWASED
jgi:Reverse transcriptase (RNA-dependent DNA polymerase)